MPFILGGLLHAIILRSTNIVLSWKNLRTASEPKKEIILHSRWIALGRCAIHLLPVSFSVVMLALNFKHLFIGIDFHSAIHSESINLALLQFAAKIQELLICSSLATIIFDLIRYKLLYGGGIPLGLVGSGIAFSDLGFFLSAEFWGSIRHKASRHNGIELLAVLVLAGIIATLAGPTSAVLLIPHLQEWPAGGTTFYMNGTMDDFWPKSLSYANMLEKEECMSEKASNYGYCPSGGFNSLWTHYSQATNSHFHSGGAQPYAQKLSGTKYYWTIRSPQSQLPRLFSLGDVPKSNQPNGSTFLIQPHLAAATMLQSLTLNWWNAMMKSKLDVENINDRFVRSRVLSPLTRTWCSQPQSLSSIESAIRFPVATNADSFSSDDILNVNSIGSNPSNHVRFSWVELPDHFGLTTAGAVFESPWSFDNQSRLVVGCTTRSVWIPSQVQIDQYSFWQGWYTWDNAFSEPYPPFVPVEQGRNNTSGRITVDDAWLAALTPPTPGQGPGYYPWHPSTIESILTDSRIADGLLNSNGHIREGSWVDGYFFQGNRTALLESIISSVVTDGLSRTGTSRVYTPVGPPDNWTIVDFPRTANFDDALLKGQDAFDQPDNSTGNVWKLRVDMAISGYSYQATLVTYLVMPVICIHIFLALTHTILTIRKGNSSGCWESVSEIIVLAQNSRPAFIALKNTAAGIKRLKTYATMVKIRPSMLPGSDVADHVELVFGDDQSYEGLGLEGRERPTSSLHESAAYGGDAELHVLDSHHLQVVSENLHATPSNPATWPVYPKDSAASSMLDGRQSVKKLSIYEDHIEPLIGQSDFPTDAGLRERVRVNVQYG